MQNVLGGVHTYAACINNNSLEGSSLGIYIYYTNSYIWMVRLDH